MSSLIQGKKRVHDLIAQKIVFLMKYYTFKKITSSLKENIKAMSLKNNVIWLFDGELIKYF